jgi:hypothetical protein
LKLLIMAGSVLLLIMLLGCIPQATTSSSPATPYTSTTKPTKTSIVLQAKSDIPLKIDTRWSMHTAYIIVGADGTIHYQVTPQALMAYGGSPLARYTWGKRAGGRFPPLGTIVDQLGIFKGAGEALAEGNYTFDVEVSDGSQTATASFPLRVEKIVQKNGSIPEPVPSAIFQQALGMGTIPLIDGKAGKTYAASLYVAGGVPPYSWFIDQTYQSNFALSGLTIDMAGGIVRGVISPAMSGQTIKFRVVVKDNTGDVAFTEPNSQIYTINVK